MAKTLGAETGAESQEPGLRDECLRTKRETARCSALGRAQGPHLGSCYSESWPVIYEDDHGV